MDCLTQETAAAATDPTRTQRGGIKRGGPQAARGLGRGSVSWLGPMASAQRARDSSGVDEHHEDVRPRWADGRRRIPSVWRSLQSSLGERRSPVMDGSRAVFEFVAFGYALQRLANPRDTFTIYQ